jgi:hypothetical protein
MVEEEVPEGFDGKSVGVGGSEGGCGKMVWRFRGDRVWVEGFVERLERVIGKGVGTVLWAQECLEEVMHKGEHGRGEVSVIW